jgi:hypothetical protein
MISSITWIPKGVAASNPARYEMSAIERELVQLMDRQQQQSANSGQGADAPGLTVPNVRSPQTPAAVLPSDLPAELRMDEYSDDEDEAGSDQDNENPTNTVSQRQMVKLGKILTQVDKPHADDKYRQEYEGGMSDAESDSSGQDKIKEPGGVDDSDDDDDDLRDVPDTREYEPVDVEGLKAMGISQLSGGGRKQKDLIDDDDDDDSDADDIRISPNDALLVVAKTEDVRGCRVHDILLSLCSSLLTCLLFSFPGLCHVGSARV